MTVTVDAEGRVGVTNGHRIDGEGARRRLLDLLADAAVSAASAGLVAGVQRDAVEVAGDLHGVGGAPAATTSNALSFVQRVCALALTEVGVSGAGVTVMGSVAAGIAGHRDQVCATGDLSRRLEDLQLTAGQGPCLDAFGDGAPVVVGDLDAQAGRWPGFAPEAVAAGAAAVFSVPLQVGAVRLGTLDLHRSTAGSLSRDQLSAALVLAEFVTETLLAQADPGSGAGGDPDHPGGSALDNGWLSDAHADVHVASGMASVSLRVGVGEALVRIRAYAYAHDEPIAQVAARIIARELVLGEDHDR